MLKTYISRAVIDLQIGPVLFLKELDYGIIRYEGYL